MSEESASFGLVTIPSPWHGDNHRQQQSGGLPSCHREASQRLSHSAEKLNGRRLDRSPNNIATTSITTDVGHLELPSVRIDTRRYSRRQLSYEEVRCIHIEEAIAPHHGSDDDVYTFRVKPVLLYVGQPDGKGRKGNDFVTAALKSGGGAFRKNDAAAIREACQQELDEYEMHRTSREVVHLSNHLLSTFETLLDPKRGGPQPLNKDLFLQSKRQVRGGLFKRKKKTNNSGEAQDAMVGMSKMDLVNDFFAKTIQVGGEVVSSSRAMQDFL